MMPKRDYRRLSAALSALAALTIAGCEWHQHASPATVQSAPVAKPAPVVTPPPSAPPATPAPVATRPATPVAAPSAPAALTVDSSLPEYRASQVVSGSLRSVGSDTMDRLMQLWEADFKKTHNGVTVRHEGKGSGTAPPALMKGLSDLGPMSRPMNSEEIAVFTQRFNHPPTQVRVALDALAVFVHPSNPIAKTGLNFQQVDAIFSSTRKRGATQDIVTWGQLGLTGEWADKPIVVYSRNKASGTYSFFKEHVLSKGDYKTTNHELAGSEDVVNGVAGNPGAIGFSSVGYVNATVLAVPLSAKPGETPVAPKPEFVYGDRYPLSRYLYLTVNYGESDPLTPATQEFLRFVLSRNGQAAVLKEGLFPVPASLARKELSRVGLSQ